MTKPNDKSLSINKAADLADSVNPDFKPKKSSLKTSDEYVKGIKAGNRTVLSQAITLIESSKQEYRELGQDVLSRLMPHTGNSIRIGITGVPGVGKSTFIEAIGQKILTEGDKLAVLAIDPTSSRSRGSILGDKTRMTTLSTHENAFIRPSPTSGNLGGVARKSRETMLLCEAAGFNKIFIETVGVGQSETTVHSMVDFFLLLMLPGAGDELQGIKRGVMEMADLIAINKAEPETEKAANRAKREYENALSLFPPTESEWKPCVQTCSALNGNGIDDLRETINKYIDLTKKNGFFDRNRKQQATHWMYETIHQQLKLQFYEHSGVNKELESMERKVQSGETSSFRAANELLSIFKKRKV